MSPEELVIEIYRAMVEALPPIPVFSTRLR
jgi:hypothetical protein